MTYRIEKKTIHAQPIAYGSGEGSIAEIPKLLGEILPRVLKHIEENGGKMAGPPFTEYLSMGETIRFRAGIPLAEKIAPAEGVEMGELVGGDVLTTVHIGPYDKLNEAYAAIEAYVAENDLDAGDSMWEFYWTDPAANPDPKDWKTELFLPLNG